MRVLLFETRTTTWTTSPAFAPAAELFTRGSVRAALALPLPAAPSTPADLLLAIDLCRAGGRSARGCALALRFAKLFPDNAAVALEASIAHFSFRRVKRAERALARVAASDDELMTARVAARRAVHAAARGLTDDARALARAAAGVGVDDAFLSYTLAYAAELNRDFAAAAEHAARARALAPRWPRCVVALCESLLARGRDDEADAALADVLARAEEDANVELYAAFVDIGRERAAAAAQRLERLRDRWPTLREGAEVRQLRAYALWRAGRHDDVKALAATDKLLAHYANAAAGGRSKVLDASRVAQQRNMCLPTAIALAATAQGAHDERWSPTRLAERMSTPRGTLSWRALDEMRAAGWSVEHVVARPEVVRALIDRGIAPVGLLPGLFEGHVEVIVGYDESLRSLIIRDPMHWAPGLLDERGLAGRYEADALLAFLPPGSGAVVDDAWRHEEARALDALERASALGDIAAAEEASARVTSAAGAARRDEVGVGVVITHGELLRRLRQRAAAPLGDDESADEAPTGTALLARARAQLAVSDEGGAADGAAAGAAGGSLFHAILRARRLMASGAYAEALATLEKRRDWLDGTESYWTLRSDALLALGDVDGARKAIAMAVQMAPADAELRARARALRETPLSAQRRFDEIDEDARGDPHDVSLKLMRAAALRDLGDAGGFVAAVREVMQLRPRWALPVEQLVELFVEQQRLDLARALVDERRPFLGAETPALPDDGDAAPAGDQRAPSSVPPWAQAARALRRHPFSMEMHAANDALDAALASARAQPLRHAALTALRVAGAAVDGRTAPGAAVADVLARHAPTGVPVAWLSTFLDELARLATSSSGLGPARDFADAYMPAKPSRALRNARARLDVALGAFADAAARARALLADDADDPAALSTLAIALASSGAGVEAMPVAERALANEPADEALRRLLVDAALQQDQGDVALRHQRALLRSRPFDRDVVLGTVDLVMNEERATAALAEAKRLADTGMLSVDAARAITAYVKACGGDTLAARKLLDTVDFNRADDDTAFFGLRLRLQLSTEREVQLDRLLETALRRFPHEPIFVLAHARSVAESGKPADARRALSQCLLHGTVTVQLAAAYVELSGDPHALIELLERNSTGRDTDGDAAALRGIAFAAATVVEPGAAEPILRRLVAWARRRQPFDVGLLCALVDVHAGRGFFGPARALADEALRASPGDIHVERRIADIAACVGGPRAALPRLHSLVERTGDIGLLMYLAELHQRLGERAQVTPLIERALAMNPREPRALALRARLLGPGALDDATIDGLLAWSGSERCADVPWLAVGAVNAARAIGDSVGEGWLPAAADRYQALAATEDEERHVLGAAIVAWLRASGEKQHVASFPFDVARVPRDWPGADWLPPALRAAKPIVPDRAPAAAPPRHASTRSSQSAPASSAPPFAVEVSASALARSVIVGVLALIVIVIGIALARWEPKRAKSPPSAPPAAAKSTPSTPATARPPALPPYPGATTFRERAARCGIPLPPRLPANFELGKSAAHWQPRCEPDPFLWPVGTPAARRDAVRTCFLLSSDGESNLNLIAQADGAVRGFSVFPDDPTMRLAQALGSKLSFGPLRESRLGRRNGETTVAGEAECEGITVVAHGSCPTTHLAWRQEGTQRYADIDFLAACSATAYHVIDGALPQQPAPPEPPPPAPSPPEPRPWPGAETFHARAEACVSLAGAPSAAELPIGPLTGELTNCSAASVVFSRSSLGQSQSEGLRICPVRSKRGGVDAIVDVEQRAVVGFRFDVRARGLGTVRDVFGSEDRRSFLRPSLARPRGKTDQVATADFRCGRGIRVSIHASCKRDSLSWSMQVVEDYTEILDCVLLEYSVMNDPRTL